MRLRIILDPIWPMARTVHETCCREFECPASGINCRLVCDSETSGPTNWGGIIEQHPTSTRQVHCSKRKHRLDGLRSRTQGTGAVGKRWPFRRETNDGTGRTHQAGAHGFPHYAGGSAFGLSATDVYGQASAVKALFDHHIGARKPRDESHSVIWEALSACRALRRSRSRSMPGGVPLASLRRRCASSFKR